MTFKDSVYFSTGVPLLYEGRLKAGQVENPSVLLRANAVVSDGPAVDYSFFGTFGMIPGFVA